MCTSTGASNIALGEPAATKQPKLATIHNVRWWIRYMERMRASIVDGSFESFRAWTHDRYPDHPKPDKSGKPRRSGRSQGRRR